MGAAVPIIMGQNIGTCVTALLSSFGTNRNARRAAMVHLSFNVIGTIIWLTAFTIVDAIFAPALFDRAANHAGIATAHSLFNIACTALLLPAAGLLEKLAYKLVPDTQAPSKITMLDERLLATPAIALERSRALSFRMAEKALDALKLGLSDLLEFDPEAQENIKEAEDFTDRCEDEIGAYLVKLSAGQLSSEHSTDAAVLLKIIGDLERIGDHARNLSESAQELNQKKILFSPGAREELENICTATRHILDLTGRAFLENDMMAAQAIEPLEEVIDRLKEHCRSSHIRRLQQRECTIEAGFVWSDILTDLERTSDHCANIAQCLLDARRHMLHTHGTMSDNRDVYQLHYDNFARVYLGEN